MLGDAECQKLDMSFTFDQSHQDKLIINALTHKTPYQLQLIPNPDLDFEDLKNVLLSKQFKVVLQSQECIKIKIGIIYFEFKNIEKLTLASLKQALTDLKSQLKEQYQKNCFLQDTIKKIRLQFDLMETKMKHLSKVNEESQKEMVKMHLESRNQMLKFKGQLLRIDQNNDKTNKQLIQVKNETKSLCEIMRLQFQQGHQVTQKRQNVAKIQKSTLDRNNYKFIPVQNQKHISLQNNNTKVTFISSQKIQTLVLVDLALKNKQNSIRFRIQSIGHYVELGLCIKSVVATNSQKIKDWKKIGHGYFTLGHGGFSYSHSHKERNDIETGFEYFKGDVIRIDMRVDEMKFVNESRNWEYKMSIKLKENEWQEACFCVFLNGDGDSVSIQGQKEQQ